MPHTFEKNELFWILFYFVMESSYIQLMTEKLLNNGIFFFFKSNTTNPTLLVSIKVNISKDMADGKRFLWYDIFWPEKSMQNGTFFLLFQCEGCILELKHPRVILMGGNDIYDSFSTLGCRFIDYRVDARDAPYFRKKWTFLDFIHFLGPKFIYSTYELPIDK